ncbi:hypothetical protein HC928_08340, partial [bacterium]|nr:hypothetical protein [bacterium]
MVLGFNIVSFTGQIRANAVAMTVRAYRGNFATSGSVGIFVETGGGTLQSSSFIACGFTAAAVSTFILPLNNVVITGSTINAASAFIVSTSNITDLKISECLIAAGAAVLLTAGSGVVSGVEVVNCRVSITALGAGGRLFSFANTGNIDNVVLRDVIIRITGGTTTVGNPAYVFAIQSNANSRGIVLDNLDVDANVGSFVGGVLLDQNIFLDTVKILNSHFRRTVNLAVIGGTTGTLSVGSVSIRGCTHDNFDAHDVVYGVQLVSNPKLNKLEIIDCVFTRYGANGGAGVRIGVDLSSTGLSSHFVVKGCTFFSIGFGSASIAAGVYYNSVAVSVALDTITICDNDFYLISSGLTDLSAAIYVRSANSVDEAVDISRNTINSVGSTTTSAATYGIYVRGVNSANSRTKISDNSISMVQGSSAAATSEVSGIALSIVTGVSVVNNKIVECTGPASGIGPNGASIRLSDNGTISDVIISNNTCDQTQGTAANCRFNIVVFAQSVSDLVISNNLVYTSATAQAGITLTRLVDGCRACKLSHRKQRCEARKYCIGRRRNYC